MNSFDSKIGTVVVISDYIKIKTNKATNETYYLQSNTELKDYTQRYVGIYLDHNHNIYIGVAVNNKKDTTSPKWWKYIIENRISTAVSNKGSFGPADKGITMVPMPYKDLLYKDHFTYNNLFGLIDPTILDMAITKLKMELEKKIKSAYNNRKSNQESTR